MEIFLNYLIYYLDCTLNNGTVYCCVYVLFCYPSLMDLCS